MKSLSIRLAAGACSLGVLAFCAATAQAQESAEQSGVEAAAPSEEIQESARTLGTVTVTAQRRSESLQDVPVMITVFGADEIAAARIQQIDDIVTRTPGLSFDAFPASQPRLYIRGIGSGDRGASGDPSSAVFLDEVYLGRPSAVAFDAFDVERIEVLKGPQGTLYGRNVVGGAINVISKRPVTDSFGAGANATVGNYGRLDGAGFLNVPLAGNTAALRMSGSYRSNDGYVKNPFLGRDVDDQETISGRLQYYAEPTDSLRLHFTLDGTRDRAAGTANHVLELDETNPLSNFYTQNFDPDVTYGSDPGFLERDTWGARGEVSYDFSFATLTALVSYRDLDYGFGYDFDGGNPDPSSPGFNAINISGGNEETAELSSQELRLSSLPDSPVTWVVGLYRYNQNVLRTDSLILNAAMIAPIELFDAFVADAELNSHAVFGDVSVPVTDKLTVFGGLRYSKDEKTQRVFNTDSNVPLRADDLFDATASADFDDLTYRAGLEYQLTSDHMAYASVSRGFKSGGFNSEPSDAAAAVTPFDPEVAVQYEIGHKSLFLDGAMIWNNSLFYVDYTDLQTTQTDNGVRIITNAGEAHIQGYETQLQLNPSSNFNLAMAYAYTDAVFDEFVEDGVDYSGNRISRSPKHKVTVSPSYTLTLANGPDLTFAVDYQYTSKIFDDNSNQPPELRDATSFVDARVMLEGLGNGMSVSLWGKNLTDERTRTFQGGFLGANFGAFNPPRTYGVTLSWDY